MRNQNISYFCALIIETKIQIKMTQLQEFIENMPHGKADEFRNRVVEACEITQGLFRIWRRGMNVPDKHHVTINRIALDMFGQKVFLDKPASTSCPDCPVAKFNACSKGVPCCQCSEENCNARQPCPKEEGKL